MLLRVTDRTDRGIIFQSTSHLGRLFFHRAAVKGPDDTFIIMDVPTRLTRLEQGHQRGSSQPRQDQDEFKCGSYIYILNVAAASIFFLLFCFFASPFSNFNW